MRRADEEVKLERSPGTSTTLKATSRDLEFILSAIVLWKNLSSILTKLVIDIGESNGTDQLKGLLLVYDGQSNEDNLGNS